MKNMITPMALTVAALFGLSGPLAAQVVAPGVPTSNAGPSARDARGNDASGTPISPSAKTLPPPAALGTGGSAVGTTMGGPVKHGDSARDAR